MRKVFKEMKDHCIRFADRQGFPIIVTICVAVITATALFTRQNRSPYVSPTPPPAAEYISAAQLLQQSLASAATATPAPTAVPVQWSAPLDAIEPLRSYDASTMVCLDSGIWAVHDAVDLKAAAGVEICAIGDGEVTAAGNDALHGAWLTIQHRDGYVSHYTGMALLNDYIPGDAVRKGDTIGFGGNGPLDEDGLGAHLHLRVTKEGQAVDPCTLWESAQAQ